MIKTFRKLPVEVQAMRWMGESPDLLVEWVRSCAGPGHISSMWAGMGNEVSILTLEGRMKVNPGDWVVRGVKGEFYPCKPEIFDLTYEEVP